MSGAASRGGSSRPDALPLQSLRAGEVQSIDVEVWSLGFERTAPYNVHEVRIHEGLVLVAGAGAVSGRGKRHPRPSRQVESVRVVEVLEAFSLFHVRVSKKQ